MSLSLALSASARPKAGTLSERLHSDPDFRVRVQAALELGASKDERALDPLIGALDDRNASVRAAAAAALGKLGDWRAIAALERHAADDSRHVRSAVKTALERLRPKEPAEHPAQRIVVKLARVQNGTRVKSSAIEREIWSESRRRLAEVPGVEVVVTTESNTPASVPLVKVTPSIQKLSAARDGNTIVYSASIDYILHSLPEEAILGRLSGSASAAASDKEAQDRAAIAALRHEVLAAAIHSALSRAPRALQAAARM